ncbi:MAG: hypothetical protein K2N35_17065 [Muribaculaceae bacterium]|nr:hypothetical protein [Muribaculaceae bacterium]
MKYYIPTSSLNFNNILSTESISPKSFYEKRGFGYSRWFTVGENCIEHLILLYGEPHMFERPKSDLEDHPMLIEIDIDEEFPTISDSIFYTDRTIYLNPWQTKFIFFTEKDKTITLSMSDSSLETKLVRLYQRKVSIQRFDGVYPIIQKDKIAHINEIGSFIEDDYLINKMKGLLYGYYIGANLSSSKEYVYKLDTLREIFNIFSSVVSSYDKTPSTAQLSRLNELFDYLDSQQPIYTDLENEFGDRQLVDRIFSIFKRHGYIFTAIDRNELILGLQEDGENNKSIAWINREIIRAKALVSSSSSKLDPDKAEIIVSVKDKEATTKAILDSQLSKLFVNWVSEVLCSKAFNGKINSIKESLSDEITKSAKNIIGADWENSPIRTYLNQLRRHVRGEEFNQKWDNGVLSSISAVLIKGDEWEQLLNFMQSKGMYDYRLAFAIYGMLNGFANLTRDFTDILLNTGSEYLSRVYREFYGQLLEKSIPEIQASTPSSVTKKPVISSSDNGGQKVVLQSPERKSLHEWQDEIRAFARSIIKRDKVKLLSSLEDALVQNGSNQDYFFFITMLDNFNGWKPGKNGPNTAWRRMQEHYVPDYNQRIGKSSKNHTAETKTIQSSRSLLNGIVNEIQGGAQTMMNGLFGADFREDNLNVTQQEVKSIPVSKAGKSILEDTQWIYDCSSLISDSKARRQFIEDMEWFVGNHQDTYIDKKKGPVAGYYAGHDRTNMRVKERLRAYMQNKLNPRSEKMRWIAEIYLNIPINKIMDYISSAYGY